MSSFTRPLDVRQIGENEWEVLTAFIYWINKEGSGDFVYIKVGTKTDFASVPRIFQWLVPKYGNQNHISVIHDFLYRHQFYWTLDDKGYARHTICSRKKADQIFLEGNKVKGVNWCRRNLMYQALRVGGWAAFHAPDIYTGFDPEHIMDIRDLV